VNAPIARLFVVFALLFGVLVVFTSRWTVLGADELRANAKNQRTLLAERKIRRGLIRAADGTVLARSVRNPDKTFSRTYPAGGLFAHAVGYSFTRFGRAGLERSYNDELTGFDGELGSLVDELAGTEREGDDVETALDPAAQRAAIAGLNGRKGAVVALDPATGAVKAMASVPGFDPGDLPDGRLFARLNQDDDNAPLLNRTTQSGYPPGSTFKVVTAIAAMDTGRYQPESTVNGRNGKPISGVPLNNFGGADFGDITLTQALTQSVNTVWAEVGEKLGKETMKTYMDRLGFGEQAAVDLPPDERRASGEFSGGRLIEPTNGAVDVGRMAIGQDKLNVTPLQMAMVAASVANDGRLMRPRLVERVRDRDGRVVDNKQPDELSRAMSSESAQKVNAMMRSVVREGSGTAAALAGIDVGGKTGTAEVDRRCGPNQAWFIGFAPARNPRIAVAATIECTEGTGGVEAAPIAKAVMQAALR
jgi:peptidoglycan glycosyltransferase